VPFTDNAPRACPWGGRGWYGKSVERGMGAAGSGGSLASSASTRRKPSRGRPEPTPVRRAD